MHTTTFLVPQHFCVNADAFTLHSLRFRVKLCQMSYGKTSYDEHTIG